LNIALGAAGSQAVSMAGSNVSGNVAAFPTVLAFGSVAVTSTSATQPVTVTNNGTGLLSVTVALAGTNLGQYIQSSTCSAALAPAATCTVNVAFKPTSTGSKPASLTVTPSNGTVRTVALSGAGL
jgi:archaellum component FlaF (FlaF/FlaG flagellin family)